MFKVMTTVDTPFSDKKKVVCCLPALHCLKCLVNFSDKTTPQKAFRWAQGIIISTTTAEIFAKEPQ